MMKMTKAQRTAVLDAHGYPGHKLRGLIMANRRTIDVLKREGWATEWIDGESAWVTMAGLIAADVDMDAIHAEAKDADARREMDLAAAEQGTPAYRLFVAAVRVAKSYGAALDILHEEADREDQIEHLGKTIVEHNGERMMIKDIPDGWERRMLGYGHVADDERSIVPVAGREWKATPDTCSYGDLEWEWVQHEGLEFLVCPRCGLDGT